MSTKYKVRDQDAAHFITATVIDWVDLFTRPRYKHIIVDSLQFCQQNKGLIVHAFVIMPSHLHLIVKSREGFKLEDIIRDFKKYTAKEIIKAIKEYPESRRECLSAEALAQAGLLKKFAYAANRISNGANHKVWKDGFHPIELNSTEMMEQKLNYIHNNPVEDEIVMEAEHYKYSSAINYCEGIGVLEVEKL